MKHHRTSAQWQQLLAQRQDFNGSNIEFCKQHDIAIVDHQDKRNYRYSHGASLLKYRA